ncbi:uncharacterized protein [Typha angustifolia]|uniref:uncharacterized protein n=1 Tax=Typha angustifolia TaxID=59011 RepID=UPI003C2C01DF
MGSRLEPGELEHLRPSRFLSFTFPNPLPDPPNPYGDPLRIAVLDSPSPPSSHPQIAALLVPLGREDDWIFSTAPGHLQLLLSLDLPLSRLVLAGNTPSSSPATLKSYSSPLPESESDPDSDALQSSLLPLLLALCPKASFVDGIPQIPFLSFDDDVVRIVPVETLVGPVVGEMLVEDVAIDRSPSPPELRRRLRFKRMPNLVQTQVRLLPQSSSSSISTLEFGSLRPEVGSLVQPYLAPMVAGLSLIATAVEERARLGLRPKALCVGVGGGALLMSLRTQFGFDVLGVEADDVVLGVARRHFGLIEDEFLRVCVGDGIEMINNSSDFDAIMVDLDAGDAMNGVSAPPLEFVQMNVLLAVKSAVHEQGVVVVNVIPSDGSFYGRMVATFREVFCELYELDVGNGENLVLMATASPVGTDTIERGGSIPVKLNEVVGKGLISCIKKIF